MKGGRVDLHIHSNKSSDGDYSPRDIVLMAKKKALAAIAIADHDSVDAYPEALEIGVKEGVEVIPNIELTTVFDDREFHLLLPFLEWNTRTVKDIIAEVYHRRCQEAQARIKKLQILGFDVTWDEVLGECEGFPPLGVTIAKILLEKAKKNGIPVLNKYLTEKNWPYAPYLFYQDYFMEGKSAFVPKKNIHLFEVMKLAPNVGAVPVLAHPGANFQRVQKEDLIQLKKKGLEGLEVYTSYHDSKKTAFYLNLARELDLVPTAGSDFHGEIKPFVPFGFLKEGSYDMVRKLRKRRRG